MRYIYILLRIIILLLLLIIAFNNVQNVSFYWILGKSELPLIILLFAFFILGIFIGVLGMLSHSWRTKRKISSLKKESRQLQDELKKNTDIKDTD